MPQHDPRLPAAVAHGPAWARLRGHIRAIADTVTRNKDGVRALAGALALGLGFWGWTLKATPTNLTGWFNNAFRTLQLITLQFPTSMEAGIPWQLQVARLLVPVLALVATFHVLVGAVTRPVRLALLPRARGHILVCGAERLTAGALTALRAQGRRVVIVAPALDPLRRDALEAQGFTCVEADPLVGPGLAALNLRLAAAVFFTEEDDLLNLNRAMMAMDAVSGRPAHLPPLLLGVLLDDEALATELDAALDDVARQHGVRYHRLCPDREGVRLEMRTHAPVFHKADLAQPSHVLVAGLAGRWQQVLAELIVAAQDHPEQAPRFTLLLNPAEQDAFNAWAAQRPDLPLVAAFTCLPAQTTTPPPDWVPPHLAVVLRGDAEAVSIALALRRPGGLLGGSAAPVLVRQSREDRVLARLSALAGIPPAPGGPSLGALAPFGGLLRPDSLARVVDGQGDALPMALHAHYLAVGTNSTAAALAWDALPENLRDANRAAAEHVPILFAAAGLPLGPGASPLTPSAVALELMARVEHRRWMADRIERGWRHAPVRNDAQRLHPALIPFDALPTAEQDKDRRQVCVLLRVRRRND